MFGVVIDKQGDVEKCFAQGLMMMNDFKMTGCSFDAVCLLGVPFVIQKQKSNTNNFTCRAQFSYLTGEANKENNAPETLKMEN